MFCPEFRFKPGQVVETNKGVVVQIIAACINVKNDITYQVFTDMNKPFWISEDILIESAHDIFRGMRNV